MTRAPHAAPLVASATMLIIYLATLAPGLVGGDTPEMIVAAHRLGVPHQPGYPLYVLLGHVLTLLPLGGAAVRVTLLSALPAAIAVGLVCRLVVRAGAPIVPAILLSLTAGLAWMTWSQAVVAEVYALGLCLGLLALDRVDIWRRGARARDLLVAAYTGGLAVGHQPLAAMLLPGVIAIVARRLRTRGERGTTGAAPLGAGTLAAATGLFVFPFTIFLVLPIRSIAGAAIDYARIGSVGDFFYHALGRASASELLSEGEAGVRRTLDLFGEVALGAVGPLTLVVALLAVWGLVRLGRRDGEGLLLVGLPLVLMLAFALVYAILDVENYLILPFTLLVVSAGSALGATARYGARPAGTAWPAVVVTCLLALVAVSAFAANRARCDRSDYHLVDDFVANTLACVPPGGVLFLYTEVLVGPFAHHALVEGARPDITLVDMTGKVLPQAWGFREIGGDWREGRWRRMEALHASPPAGLAGRPFTALMLEARPARSNLAFRRRGLVFELIRTGTARGASHDASDPISNDALWSSFRIRLPDPALIRADRTAFSLTPTIRRLYAGLLEVVAAERMERGDLDGAVRAYGQLRDVDPRSVRAHEGLALAFSRQGKPELARRELRALVARRPDATQALNALGVIALSEGERDSAEIFFRRALEADTSVPLTHLNMGMLLAQDPGRVQEAARHLREFLSLAPDDPDADHAREALRRIGAGGGSPSRRP